MAAMPEPCLRKVFFGLFLERFFYVAGFAACYVIRGLLIFSACGPLFHDFYFDFFFLCDLSLRGKKLFFLICFLNTSINGITITIQYLWTFKTQKLCNQSIDNTCSCFIKTIITWKFFRYYLKNFSCLSMLSSILKNSLIFILNFWNQFFFLLRITF